MSNEIELSLGDIVTFVRRGLVLALIAAVALGASGYFYANSQPKVYRASATAYAAERGLDLGSLGLPQLTSSTLHIDTYRAAALSDPILRQALETLHDDEVSQGAVKGLRGRMTVRTEERPRLLSIDVEAGDPQTAADTANALVEALVAWDASRVGNSLDRVVAGLEEQIVRLQENGDALSTVLAQQQDRLVLALALQVSVAGLVEVVQPASRPSSPVQPRPRFTAMLAAVFGGLLAYGFLALRSALDTNVRDPEELFELSGLPVLATFPKMRRRNRTVLREAASFLRANILNLAKGASPPVILVTSPTADQGKTTVAASLAESLARNGYRTLLVDGDLRNPSVAKYFQIRGMNHVTVVDALNRNDQLRAPSTVELNNGAKLHVLPGGAAMPQAAEFLGSSFEYALDRWRAGFQAIVVDSPPALAVADSLIMARHCTGVLVVVNAEASDRKQVRKTIDLLTRSDNRLLGVVATHVDSRAVVSYGYPTAKSASLLATGRTVRPVDGVGEPTR